MLCQQQRSLHVVPEPRYTVITLHVVLYLPHLCQVSQRSQGPGHR